MTDEIDMPTIAEVAREIDISTSELLESCASLGVDADWGGARVSQVDAERLRLLHGVDGPAGATSGLASPSVAAFAPAIASVPVAEVEPGEVRTPETEGRVDPLADPVEPAAPRTDRSVRPAVIAAAIAVGALVASNVGGPVTSTFALWILAVFTSIIALVSGNRARARITLHPEKYRGLGPARAALAAGLLILVFVGIGTYLIFRSAPAADAPLGIGNLRSVEQLRWSGQRLLLVGDHGWHRPVDDPGTCYEAPGEPEASDPTRAQVDDMERVPCRGQQTHEIIAVYAMDPFADAPYDRDGIRARAFARCVEEFPELDASELAIEMADEDGWDRSDHDAACHHVAKRAGSVSED